MADKRILIICVAILCIVALGAFILLNGGSGGIGIEDDSPNEVTIEGITFNIPEGYKEVNDDDDIETEDSNNLVIHEKYFVNHETQDDFLISVGDYGDDEITEDDLELYPGNPKTIKGHKGKIIKDEFVNFLYPENGDCVIISSANESLFEQIIPYKTVEKTTEEKSTSSSSSSGSSGSSSYSSSSSTSGSSSSDYSSVFVKNVLEMYDLNGDGGLSSSEWDYWCSREGYAPMSDCDSNGDGFCSQSELATYSHDFGY